MATEAHSTTPTEVRIKDPLSEVTRKERRALLAVSFLGVAIVQTGLLPTEISALGVKFNSTDQKALLKLLAAIVAYLMLAFTLYASSDFLAWRFALNRTTRDVLLRRARQSSDEREAEEHALYMSPVVLPPSQLLFFMIRVVSLLRATFEFLLPLVLAAYAIWTLVRAVP